MIKNFLCLYVWGNYFSAIEAMVKKNLGKHNASVNSPYFLSLPCTVQTDASVCGCVSTRVCICVCAGVCLCVCL